MAVVTRHAAGMPCWPELCTPDPNAAKAKSLGGLVMVPPTDIPGMARFAVLADPQGAAFTVVKFAR